MSYFPTGTPDPGHYPAAHRYQQGSMPVLSKLDVAIQSLDSARNACGIATVKIALDSASDLLITTRVRSLLFFDEGLLVNGYSENYWQNTGLCRSRTALRFCV